MHSGSHAAPEFELTVEEGADSRPFSGFYVTRTFFVNNWGQAHLVAAPGQRAMLQRIDALPDDAEPTRSITDPDLWMLARAAQVLGHGLGDAGALPIADFYALRGRLFHVRACRVFELRRGAEGLRFIDAAALPAGAEPFTESEAAQLPLDVVTAAARVLDQLSAAPTDALGA